MGPKLLLTRSYVLPALHTLAAPGMSGSENRKIFGDCSRLHGHDYRIEVTITGTVDPETGLLVDRDLLDRLVQDTLLEPFRGTNLSEHFRHTTGEALAREFRDLLEAVLPQSLRVHYLTLHETAKNFFIVRGSELSS